MLTQAEEIIYQRFEIPTIQATVLVPGFVFPTREARAVLPKTANYQDAIFNLGRVPMVVNAFREGDLVLLARVMKDRLHEPYREAHPWRRASPCGSKEKRCSSRTFRRGAECDRFSPAEANGSIESMCNIFQIADLGVRVLPVNTCSQGAWVSK